VIAPPSKQIPALAPAHVVDAVERQITDGTVLRSVDNVQYVVSNLQRIGIATLNDEGKPVDTGLRRESLTLRRLIPKVRGKQARKADREARRRAHREALNAARMRAHVAEGAGPVFEGDRASLDCGDSAR
jgi:hypothetical protein